MMQNTEKKNAYAQMHELLDRVQKELAIAAEAACEGNLSVYRDFMRRVAQRAGQASRYPIG